MAQDRRKPTPEGKDTGPARQTAQKALHRRLRQTAAGVEWRDAIAGAVLGQLLDALGGDELSNRVLELLVELLT
jgi:hypothetical protein